MKKFLVLSVLCSLIACSSSSATKEDKPEEQQPKNVYRNPVIDYSLPDPSVIEGDDGYYYLYATEDIRNLPIHRSKNLVDWEYVGTAFTDRTRPDFEPNGGLWAPDINKIGDKYVLYYSMSVWGGELTCGIGCATADKPEGPFTDHGKMFRSNEINVQNSIDPFYIEDGGKKYLFWGSFRGIYAIELSDDGLSLKDGATLQQVAGTAYEGTYIHKKDGHYYFFASIGSCCEGLKSTYTLKSATKLFSVLLASKRPLITELADKLRLKYPLLPTISPCPTMRLEAIRSIIPISCRRYPKSV